MGFGEANDDGKALAPVDHLGRRFSADAGLDCFADVGNIESVARERVSVDVQLDLHCSGAHLNRDVLRAAYVLNDRPDLIRFCLEKRQAIAKHLYAKLRSNAVFASIMAARSIRPLRDCCVAILITAPVNSPIAPNPLDAKWAFPSRN